MAIQFVARDNLESAAGADRIRRVLVAEVDPGGRMKLPKQKRGAGW
jgi:hypothetical protein